MLYSCRLVLGRRRQRCNAYFRKEEDLDRILYHEEISLLRTGNIWNVNTLLKEGKEEEALKWVLRERGGQAGQVGKMIYGRNKKGEFILVPDADGDNWELDWPVLQCLTWDRALAFTKWKSRQSGLLWRLLHELNGRKEPEGSMRSFFCLGRWF